MSSIRIKHGLDVRVAGSPRQELRRDAATVRSVALLGEDYPGLRPVFAVEQGAKVRAGQVLFTDRRRPRISWCAPVGGTVESITRGARRSLDTLVIRAEGDEAETFTVPHTLDREALTALLLESGSWPSFRIRPYGRIADPGSVPDAVFVTAIDTAPLAADPAVVIGHYADWFRRGASVLHHLTDGKVHLCHAAGAAVPKVENTHAAAFSGPHPAGLPGTHIHHLHPVGHGGSVWHIGYQDVIAIGCLLETGRVWTDRVVALGGPHAGDPCLLVTRPGASLKDLTAGRLKAGHTRILTGSPLDGRTGHFLGRYHLQVSALAHTLPPEGNRNTVLHRFLAFARRGTPAVIPNAAHERAAPAGILPIPFLRAISIADVETARRLGALELVEEDMALLGFVDGRGDDYAALLRAALDELEAAQ